MNWRKDMEGSGNGSLHCLSWNLKVHYHVQDDNFAIQNDDENGFPLLTVFKI
jgi:hypothetical protein